jgi:hypothetical protein
MVILLKYFISWDYSNQEVLPSKLEELFQALIGQQHNQVGEAVFHVQIALQGLDNDNKFFW